MTKVKLTKLSSRGQIVIPKELRGGFREGTPFAVVRSKDTLILKKVQVPGIEEFEALVDKGVKIAKRLKLKKEDINAIIHRHKSA